MNNYVAIFGVRTGIVFFWAICLIFFLFFPNLKFWWHVERTLNVLIWTGTISSSKIAAFERETGIKVNIMYFENNEELFVKLYTSRGRGYDLIMPSDHLVPKLIEYQLIKQLDKTKLNFWQRLDTRLLNQYFDKGNKYTIPYYWGIYGIGINKKLILNEVANSWALLLNQLDSSMVGMANVAREAISIASLYLFKGLKKLTVKQVEEVKRLLINQKPHVMAYIDADVRANYMLISQNVPLTIASSPYIHKIMITYPFIQFIIPREGTFKIIDNFAISATSTNDDLTYLLINYLYRPEVLEYQFYQEPFFPTTIELAELMKKYHVPQVIQEAHLSDVVPLYFFKNILSENQLNDIWLSVKTI